MIFYNLSITTILPIAIFLCENGEKNIFMNIDQN